MTSMGDTSKTVQGTTGQSGRDHVSAETKHLRDDLGRVKEDVSSLTRAATEYARSEADHIADYAQAGADKMHEYHTQFRRNVAKHPTAAVLTTLGVGIILGRLIAR